MNGHVIESDSVETYALSPLQQGMVFHSLYHPQSGVDIEQLLIELPEALNARAFQTAWQKVVERYPILRSSFHWSGLDQPRQEVHGSVRIHWEFKDWSGLSAREQENRLDAYLQADRRRGLNLALAPLMRLALMRIRETKYWLVWTFHHLLLDGRSLVVLLNELFAFYEAHRDGYELDLQEPPRYRDYIEWLQSQDLGPAEQFWRQELAGFDAPAAFSADTPAGAAADSSPEPAEQEFSLSDSLTAALRTFAVQHGLTLNTLVQGAWSILLSRSSRSDDVAFGAIRACRRAPVPAVERMVGLLINTVPVRVRVKPSAKLLEWLRGLRQHWVALREFEHAPLLKVQEWSGQVRGQPLFETLLNVQDPTWDQALRAQGGLWRKRKLWVKSQSNYALAVDVYGGPDRMTVKMWYDRRRFEDATIHRLLRQMGRVLEGMTERAEQLVGEVPWMSAEERQRVTQDWNQTDTSIANNRTVLDLIEEQVARSPEALAVASDDDRLSYAELDRRAERVSGRLCQIGVGPEDLVGVCLKRSVRMVAAWMGVWKAGGAYVPLDASCPAERLRFLAVDAKVRVVITERPMAEWWRKTGIEVVCVEDCEEGSHGPESVLRPGNGGDAVPPHPGPLPPGEGDLSSAQGSTEHARFVEARGAVLPLPEGEGRGEGESDNPGLSGSELFEDKQARRGERRVRSKHLAYVIYTSGSTGQPKGVAVEHGSLLNLAAWHQRTYQVTAEDRATQLAGTAYDACVWEIWPYLAAGASVFIAGDKTRMNPKELIRWLAEKRASICFLPTTLAHAVMEEHWPDDIALRAVLTGGEKLLRRPGRKFPCPLLNHYGPTEDTVVTTWARIERSHTPIGRPIANTQVFVLDRHGKPVPVGVSGELHIGGLGLARGYIHHPDLTAERFIPNPFSREAGSRLYKSGDQVRYLPDGNLEFLGRTDAQVKIRGHRVELGEIESVLCEHPNVREAAVTLRPNASGEDRLAAYVVPRSGPPPAVWRLREFLKARLPEHMVPSAFLFLEALPLTANGKVDRKALFEIKDESEGDTTLALPRTPTEQALAEVWEEVLGVKRAGAQDNFFDLGGHSMLATQVISRVYRIFQCELSVRDLFECPTVAELARRIDRAHADSQPAQSPALVPRAHRPERVLSFAQERLWFLEQLEPGQAFNNIPIGLRLEGPLDLEALRQSLADISRRHESLRTSFRSIGGKPVAQIDSDPLVPLVVVDLVHRSRSAAGSPASFASASESAGGPPALQTGRPFTGLRNAETAQASDHPSALRQRSDEPDQVKSEIQNPRSETEIRFLTSAATPDGPEALKRLVEDEARQPFDLSAPPLWRAKLVRLAEADHYLVLNFHHAVADGWSLGVFFRELRVLYEKTVNNRRHTYEPQVDRQGVLPHPGPLPLGEGESSSALGSTEDAQSVKTRDSALPLPAGEGRGEGDRYAAPARGTLNAERPFGSALPDLPIQYSDFAAWQREWLSGGELDRQLAYWKRQLAAQPPALNLPTDRPRPAVQSYRGAKVFFALPTSLSKSLRKLGHREDVTQFMLLLAALQTLLFRYSGQADVAVGSPIAGRRRVETESLIGFFANTLVLRVNLSGDPTFREVLRRVRQVALEAYSHQDLPFEKLVEGLQVERNLSHSPLFQVMFIFQRSALPALDMAGLRLTPAILDSGTSKFDLTLSLEEDGDDISGFIEYDTALFDPGTITRLLGHYQTLLEGVAAHSEQRISSLPLLSPVERNQVLVEWNSARLEQPIEPFVHGMIERQARQTPEAVAVVCAGQQLSYAELNARADQWAHHLQSLGVGPEAVVGLFMEPCVETVVALLAALKAGGAYLPLDPLFPRERLEFMLADAQPLAVLTQTKLIPELPPFRGEVICVDGATQTVGQASRLPAHSASGRAIAGASTPNLPAEKRSVPQSPPDSEPLTTKSRLRPENLAYVIYTSGSTGKPKAVGVTHAALAVFLHAMRKKLGLEPDDVLLSVTTLSFDIAALELYLPLTLGARVVLVSRETATDGAELQKTLRDSRATVMQATPATWRLLLESGWKGMPGLTALSGGETLPRQLANSLADRCAALWNLYGPTETTIWSAAERVLPGDGPVPTGRPIAETQIYVLDGRLEPVPIGVAGEVYIGGAGVARGYRNRPDLTAERFVPDAFGPRPGQRLYRTGDLARFLADGRIEHLGRLDHQVKLRGYRIELGEVEAALRRHAAIRESVVALQTDGPGREHLVAYVATGGHRSLSFDELRAFLKEKLPSYMIPSIFVSLESLPMTPNGKIDRPALPLPGRSAWREGERYTAPRTALEEILAGIWTKLFGQDRVSIRADFFKLGGHSLLAVQLIARIRTAFKIDLPVRVLFEAPTIEQLALALIRLQAAPGRIEAMAQLMKRVKRMSANEVRSALREKETESLWRKTASPR
ncbi:MAG: amino acid adenylation domain-containing protein [Verrucomicrobia bacterium]|nr:amino acid adenylation domain-containing protein [Verrucomicrobiota bacterium]